MTATPQRLPTLDGLRGLAVMGILLMNIAAFAMPFAAYFNPLAYGAAGPAEIALWMVEFVLVDGKMRAIFSLLFGASLLIVLDRARAAGADGERIHFRRMGWLLAIGLAHFYFIWDGDILSLYAVVGCAAWFFAEAPPRDLVRWGMLLLVLQGAMFAILFAAVAGGAPDGASWIDLQQGYGIPPADAIARELTLHRGPYLPQVVHRLTDSTMVPLVQMLMFGPETLGLMLLGMAGLRSGFLTGGWSRAGYVRAALIGYGTGLPLSLLLAAFCWWRGFDALIMFGAAMPLGLPARPFMALGHIALAMIWLTGGRSALRDRVAAAGRVALSNYLGSSLLMTGLFYGYGLGLYGRLDRFALLGIVVATWAIMLVWSRFWLDRFVYGPFEWLWRSLARGKMQPIRRQDIARHSQ
ncbi:hypothetical protein G432_05640 [Sphingomonas sp. MM-1]|uniref:DUF418 domain-containing protein n=1 Tax=Sphingomonas sp. MM-1 TaxID=745310 RepID=UPI0002C15876|nr:DUF418 domain-containing protein [Sphingomonas sp. MM-1]AGH48855.1 hypothetical protein G432_05640 [Sphingomonas sp. MM-1]